MYIYGLRVGQYHGVMDSLAQSALRCGRPPTEQYGHSGPSQDVNRILLSILEQKVFGIGAVFFN